MLDFDKFIKDDDIHFVRVFLKSNSPNALFPGTNCPIAVYALVNNANKIFTSLIHAGATLHVEDLIRCVPETQYTIVIKTLMSTNTQVVIPSIHSNDVQEQFEREIQEDTEQQRLGEFFKRRRKMDESGASELQILVEHMVSDYDKQNYVLDHFAIGLLAQYSPEEIINTIVALYPKLNHPQKLLACLGVKEILKYYTYHDCDHINIDAFVKLIAPQFPKLSSLLKGFALLRQKQALHLNNLHNINAFLMHVDVKKGKPEVFFNAFHIKSDNMISLARKVSNDLRAIVMRYAQSTQTCEFSAYQRQVVPKTPNGCPNIFELINFLAKLSNYLTSKILRSSSKEESEHFLNFCIHLLANLLDEQNPEFNCAMAISLAINSHTIARLKIPLRKNMVQLWAQCNEKLNYSGNYGKIRDYLKSSSQVLPCYFLLMKDLTFSGENALVDFVSLRGCMLKDFLSRQQCHLMPFSIFETDILRLINQFNETPDDELNTMSLRLSRVGADRRLSEGAIPQPLANAEEDLLAARVRVLEQDLSQLSVQPEQVPNLRSGRRLTFSVEEAGRSPIRGMITMPRRNKGKEEEDKKDIFRVFDHKKK